MSNLTSKLKKFLKGVVFQLTNSLENNYQELQNKISSDACLHYFNASKPVIIQVDASIRGLGALLIQADSESKNSPVEYTSKSITPAESRYANIMWDMLVVIFGCMRLPHYLYDQKFTCQNDHKPLNAFPGTMHITFCCIINMDI